MARRKFRLFQILLLVCAFLIVAWLSVNYWITKMTDLTNDKGEHLWLASLAPPNYTLSMHYMLPHHEKSSWDNFPCHDEKAVVRYLAKRAKLYKILSAWQALAKEVGMVWWLHYGSLLAAVRNRDMNPWDSDVDVCLLGDHEANLRNRPLIEPFEARFGIRIHARPREHCLNDQTTGLRTNCQGDSVDHMADECSFCGPLARAFIKNDYLTYLDVYLCKIHANGTFFDEGTQEFPRDHPVDVRATDIFPLGLVKFMGLDFPAPRNASRLLSAVYGREFLSPRKLCNPETHNWIEQNSPR